MFWKIRHNFMENSISKLSEIEPSEKSSKKLSEIKKLTTDIAERIQDAIKISTFFDLPIQHIFKILDNVKLCNLQDPINVISTIIQNIAKNNNPLLLLNHLNFSGCKFTLEDYSNIFTNFKDCSLFDELKILFTQGFQTINDSNLDIFKSIIEGYQFSPFFKDYSFSPPLFHACQNGQLELVKYLIEKQNVQKAATLNGENTALHIACAYGHIDIVKYLIDDAPSNEVEEDPIPDSTFITFKKPPFVDIPGYFNRTPLHVACLNNQEVISYYLLEHCNANVNAKDNNGDTPLHFACQTKNLKLVQLLISHNANSAEMNLQRISPLKIAFNNSNEIYQYLLTLSTK